MASASIKDTQAAKEPHMNKIVCPNCSHQFVPLQILTEREREIAKLVALGDSNKVVARKLELSDGTVKMHVHAVLKKLGLRSRYELPYWIENQL